ncbi:hypothetical protein BDW74DRAFT_19184 [Aspergillus multicolor]|uniref:uncharacterized protein n=1 Tax=Aspergillus multicolor TaxID=41759 RepID=UPI003CCCD540
MRIEANNPTDPGAAVKDILAHGISQIDLVIANAGGAGEKGIIPLDTESYEITMEVFAVNALGPLALYQAVKPLLEKSRSPRWMSISSAAGSIGRLEVHRAHVAPAYGIAKAGLNWLTTAIHSANTEFIAFAVHPG